MGTALSHIVDTSDDIGLDGRFPRIMRDLAAAAVDSGHGRDGWSRIVEQLRKPAYKIRGRLALRGDARPRRESGGVGR